MNIKFKWGILNVLLLFIFLPLTGIVSAEVPENYYDGCDGTNGVKLRAKLHSIIKGHTEFSYKQIWDVLKYTDEDPEDPNNVVLLYTGWSKSKEHVVNGKLIWNREHVWAKSHGKFGTIKPQGTDAHHIRPSDVSVNAKRGHLDFDDGGMLYIDPDGATECKSDVDSWEAGDSQKGDVARMIFYMAVRYEGDDGLPDLKLADKVSTYPSPFHGKLSTLLKWHKLDPVDDWERRRNDRVYDKQRNRNPFIDHPEFATLIWN